MLLLMTFDTPGERRDFAALYLRYRRLMFRVACDVLEDRFLAEDAVQSAFLKASRHLDRLRVMERDAVKRYLVVIAKNAAIDLLRKEEKQREREFSMDELGESAMAAREDETELDNAVLEAFRKLPDIYRDVFLLKYSVGLDNADDHQRNGS